MAKPTPKRLTISQDALLALQSLTGILGPPTSDSREIGWPCGCQLRYSRLHFGCLFESTNLKACPRHRQQGSFFPPPPD